MATVVLPGRHAPEHEGQLEEGEGGREVELVQEQLAQEHEGEHQPVPAELVSLLNVKKLVTKVHTKVRNYGEVS